LDFWFENTPSGNPAVYMNNEILSRRVAQHRRDTYRYTIGSNLVARVPQHRATQKSMLV
jgi:hypothetical protein